MKKSNAWYILVLCTVLRAQPDVAAPTTEEWKEYLQSAANPDFHEATAAKMSQLSPIFRSAPPSHFRDVLVPLLLPELTSSEDRRRLNASALLGALTILRTDTATIFKGYSPAIGKTLRMGKDRPTYNCVLALARMKPAIDVETAGVLSEWLKIALVGPASDESVVTAAFGVARCSACVGREDLVVKVLQKMKDTYAGLKLVKAIGEGDNGGGMISTWILDKARQSPQDFRLTAISAMGRLGRKDDLAITTMTDIARNEKEPSVIRQAAHDALRVMEFQR